MSGKQKELREKELREKLQDKGKDEYYSFYSNPLFNCDNSLSKGLEEVLPKEECKVLCSNSMFTSDDSLLKGLEEFAQEEGKAPNVVLNVCKTPVPQGLDVPTLNTSKG